MVVIDRQTFQSLYKRHYNLVRRIAYRYGLRDAEADDVVQDTFVKAWTKRDSLRDPGSFAGWVAIIAKNEAIGRRRTVSNQKQIPIETVLIPISAPALKVIDRPGAKQSKTASMSVTLEKEDLHIKLVFEHSLELLTQLITNHAKEPRATIARMFYLDHKSIDQIVAVLSIKQNTVLSHLRRFRLIVTDALLEIMSENVENTVYSVSASGTVPLSDSPRHHTKGENRG